MSMLRREDRREKVSMMFLWWFLDLIESRFKLSGRKVIGRDSGVKRGVNIVKMSKAPST
jgi:hypothetical protein